MNVSTFILNASAKAGFVLQTLRSQMTEVLHSLLLHGDLVITMEVKYTTSMVITILKNEMLRIEVDTF